MPINPPNHRVLISELCAELDHYLPKSAVKKIYQAYLFAAAAHDGQHRQSGEAYISHPVAVAMILAKLQLDYHCIVAALLHDCIEDTLITFDNIKADFGDEIAQIVEGVSKLTGLEFHTNADQQAQNFRKLFLAMSNDMRVIVIKLADRLHNMRTLGFVSRAKQLRIAKETVDIHAPIARRLGLNNIRAELDNLCFAIIYPFRYRVLAHQIKKRYGNRSKIIQHIRTQLLDRLQQEGVIEVDISGRKKQPCSIYQKMKIKQLKFSQVLDMYAFRLIVKDVAACYQTLGIVHNLYKPLPGKFKDYIALAKSNGYQSLHTVLFGPNKIFIEVQIRSTDMHFTAEYGIAAHWHYKSGAPVQTDLANNWLSSLLEIQQNSATSAEFLEITKNDLFPSEVFVFTPDGEIIRLPYQSTVLDFAYMVHTTIGNHTVKAKVDQVGAALSTVLVSGQTVEIITEKHAKPHPSWLQIVITAKAKSSIKSALKAQSNTELVRLGQRLLNNAFNCQTNKASALSEAQWQACLDKFQCASKADLYARIALCEVLISAVLSQLQCEGDACAIQRLKIERTDDKTISFAHCCYPVPGDKVAGVLTTSKGLVMHRASCGNFLHAKHKNAQWMAIDWQGEAAKNYESGIFINVSNQRGTLAAIAQVIFKLGVNIEHLAVREKDNAIKGIDLVILVKNTQQLGEIARQLKALEFVQGVSRL